MIIEKIAVGIPKSSVSNDDILELIKTNSPYYNNNIEYRIKKFFSQCGAKTRFWRENNNEPDLILRETTKKCFTTIDKSEIDIVIFCSVTKYFAEPSHSSLFCKIAGLKPKLSFDVSDGCMGWITALSLLSRYGEDTEYNKGLIICHEFPMGKDGAVYPKAFTVNDKRELHHKLPAYTLGESTVLTIVDMNSDRIRSNRVEIPTGSDLCFVAYRNYEDYIGQSNTINIDEEFSASFSSMSKLGAKKSIKLINDSIKESWVNFVPHSYAHSFDKLTMLLKCNIKMHNYFSEYGNVGTSSIPLNLYLSIIRDELLIDKPIYAWCASAGMKLAVAKLDILISFIQEPLL